MTAIRHHVPLGTTTVADALARRATVAAARHITVALGTAVLLLASLALVADAPTADAVSSSAGEGPPSAATGERIQELSRAASAAAAAWEDTADRVLDDAVRASVHQAIAHADGLAQGARYRVVWPGERAEDVAAALTRELDEASAALAAQLAELEEAVAAWEAEQARLEAEAEAARQAAAEAAAAAARVHAGAPRAVAGSGVAHVEGIWTSGGQAQIDACRGSVNVGAVASYLGGAFYAAEHWSCGGSAWGGIGVGALVEFPGYGVYRVDGRIGGLSYGADASVLPAGYGAYYQTCIGGSASNMTVWLLNRVG